MKISEMNKAPHSFEKLIPIYQVAWRHVPDESNFHCNVKNFKESQTEIRGWKPTEVL